MSDHTPGPWVERGINLVSKKSGPSICEVHMWKSGGGFEEVNANKSLILASPDMFTELCGVPGTMALLMANANLDEQTMAIGKEVIKDIQAVLAKAKGETS